MTELPNVRMYLSNRAENVLLVREMLTGVGEAIDLDSGDLYDIRTAVTEACNNVVLHAYEGEEGPMEIEVRVSEGAIEVLVRDHGIGIRPRIRASEETALGIGLPLIQALVHSVEFSRVGGGGTEVRMEFLTPPTRVLESLQEPELAQPPISQQELATTTAVTIAPASLACTVLPRVLSVLAARAHFSTDRISDAQLLADALVAHAPSSLGGDRLAIAIAVEPRNLELRVGPLHVGRADRLMLDSAVDGLGPVIERLTDDHRVAAVGSSEMLALQLTDRR